MKDKVGDERRGVSPVSTASSARGIWRQTALIDALHARSAPPLLLFARKTRERARLGRGPESRRKCPGKCKLTCCSWRPSSNAPRTLSRAPRDARRRRRPPPPANARRCSGRPRSSSATTPTAAAPTPRPATSARTRRRTPATTATSAAPRTAGRPSCLLTGTTLRRFCEYDAREKMTSQASKAACLTAYEL